MVGGKLILLVASLTFNGLDQAMGQCHQRNFFAQTPTCDSKTNFRVSVNPAANLCQKYHGKDVSVSIVATNPGTHFSVHELCVNVVGVTVVDITLVTPSGFPMKDKIQPSAGKACYSNTQFLKSARFQFEGKGVNLQLNNFNFEGCLKPSYVLGKTSKLEEEVAALKKNMRKTTKRINAIQKFANSINMRLNNQYFKGFSATMSKKAVVGTNEVVPFDRGLINPDSDYDTTTSIFTCPVTGFYYISVSVVAMENSGNIQIVKEDRNLLGAFTADSGLKQGSAQVVMFCKIGEKIFARNVGEEVEVIAFTNGGFVSGFSAFLISAMNKHEP